MQIWRMKPDGSEQTQVTNDEFNNWFPHISPDGKSMVIISYGQDVEADEHPYYKQVYLRQMPMDGGRPKVIAYVWRTRHDQRAVVVARWQSDRICE